MNERGRPLSLLSGILMCPACGERMYVHHRRVDGTLYGQYYCASRAKGKSDCQAASISETLADEAMLREVVRLERRPWDPGRFDQAVQADPNEGLRRRLATELADAKAELQDNARAYAVAGDFSPEVTDAFRAVAQQISLKIRHLEDQLATLPQQTVDTVRAKEVHDILASHDIADFVRGAQERGDREVLRDILRTCVLRAWISERGSATGTGRSARWAKATVEWTPEVQLLLASGHLTLGPEAEVPGRKSERELAAERARRYRARKKERAATTPLSGLGGRDEGDR